MPKGHYSRKSETSIVPISKTITLATLSWWEKLNPQEQTEVQNETNQLIQAMVNYGYSRLAIGEHLSKVRAILEPHSLFGKYLKNFRFSVTTAYRYISGYENVQNRLPQNILKLAMAKGYDIIGTSEVKPLGVYTDAVNQLPPPPHANDTQAETWLEQVEQVRKTIKSGNRAEGAQVISIPQDPDVLLKECYKFVSIRYKKLPINHKTRAAWVRSLVGMMLTELGVGGSQAFSPVAIPQEFQAGRGRPRLVQAASA